MAIVRFFGNLIPLMPLRHSLVLVGCAGLIAACGKQQQPAQAATLDSAKVAAAAAPVAVDSELVRADRARIQGSEKAKVWLVMASDFECPYCRAFHDGAYQQILKDYVATGKVRVAFLNHPGSMHVHAMVSAEAAMCAATQDHFWPMHDALFTTQDHWAALTDPMPVFDSLATSLELGMVDWRACMTSHKTRPMIEADHAKSKASGVSGTPTFFIANKLAIVGAEPYATFRAALDSALAHAVPPSGGGQRP
jgi:protein-disulfide isomerase